jgi:hypothetical protein
MTHMKAFTLLLLSSAGLGLLGMSSASAAPASGAVISDTASSVGQLTENVQWRGRGFGGFGWRGGGLGWRGAGLGWRGGGFGWRGGGWGWGGVGLGLAAGAVIGSALAAPYYDYGYYDYPAYTYAPAYYGYGYAPAYGYGYDYGWRRPFWGARTFATLY